MKMSLKRDYPRSAMAVKQEKILAHQMRGRSQAVIPEKETEIVQLLAPGSHNGLKPNYTVSDRFTQGVLATYLSC